MTNSQEKLFKDKRDLRIQQLEKKVATLTKQKENLKTKNANLKLRLEKQKISIRKLEEKLMDEGKIQEPPVKRIWRLHPEIGEAFTALCQEWHIKTLNMRNTSMAILRVIEPDANGVVEYSPKDVVYYINYLRRMGRSRYMANATLATYYEPSDSLVLFKHFKAIRRIVMGITNPVAAEAEKLGFKYAKTKIGGIIVQPETRTAVCSWEDLRKQKRGAAHVNDSLSIDQFKGDDQIRERTRREISKTGVELNEQQVLESIRYLAKKKFGRDIEMEALMQTEIKEREAKNERIR